MTIIKLLSLHQCSTGQLLQLAKPKLDVLHAIGHPSGMSYTSFEKRVVCPFKTSIKKSTLGTRDYQVFWNNVHSSDVLHHTSVRSLPRRTKQQEGN